MCVCVHASVVVVVARMQDLSAGDDEAEDPDKTSSLRNVTQDMQRALGVLGTQEVRAEHVLLLLMCLVVAACSICSSKFLMVSSKFSKESYLTTTSDTCSTGSSLCLNISANTDVISFSMLSGVIECFLL